MTGTVISTEKGIGTGRCSSCYLVLAATPQKLGFNDAHGLAGCTSGTEGVDAPSSQLAAAAAARSSVSSCGFAQDVYRTGGAEPTDRCGRRDTEDAPAMHAQAEEDRKKVALKATWARAGRCTDPGGLIAVVVGKAGNRSFALTSRDYWHYHLMFFAGFHAMLWLR